MKWILTLTIMLLFAVNASVAFPQVCDEPAGPINDGPYIFNDKDALKVRWIKGNKLKEITLDEVNFAELKKDFDFLFDYSDLIKSFHTEPSFTHLYSEIDSICVLSDVHGEYSVYLGLLQEMGVIDDELNWNYGKGHLVLLGDVFDRGSQVTEVLWHLFGLEIQAAEAGGRVHLLLGNHELMVLSEDLRYINPKYSKVELITRTSYSDLFSVNSVLGNWLRSKPVIITINDIIFAHGGISMELVKKELEFREINQMFFENITGKVVVEANDNRDQLFLIEDDGPVWYRGYFNDSTFCETRIDSILSFYNKKHIVVGHTTTRNIRAIFNNKVIGVDAGIGVDQPGQVLLYENGNFYKGTARGEKIRLQVPQ